MYLLLSIAGAVVVFIVLVALSALVRLMLTEQA